MSFSDTEIDMFAEITWKKLKRDPLDNYEYLCKNESGAVIIQAHKDFVRCLIANDFDPRKATKVFSKGQGTFDELEPSGKEFREKLAGMLKELVKQHRR